MNRHSKTKLKKNFYRGVTIQWIGCKASSLVIQYNLFANILGCSDLGVNDSNIRILDPSTGDIILNIPQTFNSSVYITCVDDYYLSAEEFGQCKYS